MIRVLHVVGARPNFMKTAPIMAEMAREPDLFEQILVHTGQHYDDDMSRVFFDELSLPEPDYYLGVGSGTHAEQTARVMLAFEPLVLQTRPDVVLVVGDVNSTLACAIVCSKLGVAVGHVEAGLRSFDRTMPEEINRLLTDQISDWLFTPSTDADVNLLREGIPPHRIHRVGNVMIDSLVTHLPKAERRRPWKKLGVEPPYVLVTLHRPSNVDQPEILHEILSALQDLARNIPVIFPVHPRTRRRIAECDLEAVLVDGSGLILIDPLGYLDFLSLMRSSRLVITDSGGVQEETTFLGIPCLTVRPNTERPVTVEVGTNRLVAPAYLAIRSAVKQALASGPMEHRVPKLWDGKAAERIIAVLAD